MASGRQGGQEMSTNFTKLNLNRIGSLQVAGVKRDVVPGDPVVPVSEIRDLLQSKIDASTLEQLLQDIISGRRTQVKPGELITADLMNQILTQLESLNIRVTELENGSTVPSGQPVITGLQPSAPVAMQSELRIFGRNFGQPASNVVTIDGVAVRQFKDGSSDAQLIIDVPLIAGVPEQGKIATLTVSNPQGFAQTSIVIRPAVQTTPQGSLFVTLSQSPPDERLLAGQSYTFVFAVQAITNLEELFSLSPTVSSGWPAAIVGQNNEVITPEIRIPRSDPPAGTTRDVRVRVTIPTGTAIGAAGQLRLAVTSRRNPLGLNKTSGGDTITVGEEGPPPQQIVVSFGGVISPAPPAPQARRDENNVVVIPVLGTAYRVDFSVLMEEPGTNIYNILLTPPGGQWTAQLQGAATIPTTGPSLNRLVGVTLRAQNGAAPANLTMRITRAGDETFFGQFTQQIRFGT